MSLYILFQNVSRTSFIVCRGWICIKCRRWTQLFYWELQIVCKLEIIWFIEQQSLDTPLKTWPNWKNLKPEWPYQMHTKWKICGTPLHVSPLQNCALPFLGLGCLQWQRASLIPPVLSDSTGHNNNEITKMSTPCSNCADCIQPSCCGFPRLPRWHENSFVEIHYQGCWFVEAKHPGMVRHWRRCIWACCSRNQSCG